MSEYLSYNGYTFDPDMCHFTIDRHGIVGQTGRIMKVRNIWNIHGRVNAPVGLSNAASKAAVDAKVVAVETAIRDGGDLVFSLGSTMKLLTSDCLEGTHVKKFSWLTSQEGVNGSAAEGVLRRSFNLVIYGDILVTTDTDIIHWSESMTYVGTGLARVVPVGSLAGTVKAQQTQAYTPFWMIQSGMAIGLTSRPTPPTPTYQGISGIYYDPSSLSSTIGSPRRFGINRNTEFPVRWNYKCWSSLSLLGAVPGVI